MQSSQRILVVGAGLSGTVVARELADAGYSVTVIDKRSHIAGNAYDYVNEYGIRVHKYGPHLFHTSNEKVVAWLSRFTEWEPYKHRVKAMLADGRLVTLPVNAETTAIVGKDRIIDVLFRPYTLKMWGKSLEELDPSIVQRIPIGEDLNEFYFPNDSFQALPKNGYTAMVGRALEHENIQVCLNTAFDKKFESDFGHVFNSMPIDEYFDYCYGELPYRSLRFQHITVPIPRLFPVAQVNFTHEGPHTRVTEWKNLPGHGHNPHFSSLTIEEPCDYKDNFFERYYPVRDLDGTNRSIYTQYEAQVPSNVRFIGRCGLYAYLDMHQAVSSALSIAAKYSHKP